MRTVAKLTVNELTMLQTIARLGGLATRIPFNNPFESPMTGSGVCASLSRKGLAYFDPFKLGDAPTMIITEKGVDALRAADSSWSESLRDHFRLAGHYEAERVGALRVQSCRRRLDEARAIAFREAMRRRVGDARLTDKRLEEIARVARADLAELESFRGIQA